MTNQKRIGLIALVAVVCLLFGAPSFAATVTVGDYVKLERAVGNSGWSGGAFQATIVSPSGTTIGSTWTTFCLEVTEYFSPGSIYQVNSVGFNAIGGGAGSLDPLGTTPIPSIGPGDPISYQTAYLYNAYLNNRSALGITGTGTGAQQESLQKAFWYLENEITSISDLLVQTYVDYALDYKGTDDFGVRVFNPVTLNGAGAIVVSNQSMLYQSVPEAGALLLFGTGLVGLVGYRRVRRMK